MIIYDLSFLSILTINKILVTSNSEIEDDLKLVIYNIIIRGTKVISFILLLMKDIEGCLKYLNIYFTGNNF